MFASSFTPSRSMTPPAPNRPITSPSNTHIRSPSTVSTCGTRSLYSAGAREVKRSGGSHQCESASTTKPFFDIDVNVVCGMPRATVDGVSIAFEVIGDGPRSWGITPGGRFSKDSPGVRELAAALAELGNRVLIWDRPNCGESDV